MEQSKVKYKKSTKKIRPDQQESQESFPFPQSIQNGQHSEELEKLLVNKIINNILSPIILNGSTISSSDSPSVVFSIINNAIAVSKFFDTPEKENWLDTHQDKLKELIQDTLFDKNHFITENYEILERRLEKCMSS